MIFSLQPCRGCIIDGFNSDQFSQGLSLPGLSLPGISRNDRVLLQRFHRPRRAFGAVGGEERSAHDRAGLSLPGLQCSVWPLRAHHSAHHGRSARGLRSPVDVLPERPTRPLTGRSRSFDKASNRSAPGGLPSRFTAAIIQSSARSVQFDSIPIKFDQGAK